MKVSVYCSGSITKGTSDAKKLTWSDTERMEVAKGAEPFEVVFLNPDDPITDPANTLGQFGRDMYQVMVATAVIVDARERRGLGIGVEMAAAGAFGTPVIVVAPRNSKYRADMLEYRGVTVHDYVHPHVAALSAAIVDDFLSAGRVLADLVGCGAPSGEARVPDLLEEAIIPGSPGETIVADADEKGHEKGMVPLWLEKAIGEYRANVLAADAPMLEALRRLDLVPG